MAVILIAVVLPITSNNPIAQAVSTDPVVTAPAYVDFSSQTWAAGSFGISGYSVDATVTQYGKSGETLKTYKFVGLFPQDVAPIDLDWGSNDSIEEYAITFAYQWWESDSTT